MARRRRRQILSGRGARRCAARGCAPACSRGRQGGQEGTGGGPVEHGGLEMQHLLKLLLLLWACVLGLAGMHHHNRHEARLA
jgi:hypothetical protein